MQWAGDLFSTDAAFTQTGAGVIAGVLDGKDLPPLTNDGDVIRWEWNSLRDPFDEICERELGNEL
jgi:hypothetical protein